MFGADRFRAVWPLYLFLVILLTGIPITGSNARINEAEEIVVGFRIPRLITQDILVQYDGQNIYLPLMEIFQLLEIYIKSDFNNGRFSGKFLEKDNEFEIDLSKLQAKCFGKTTNLAETDYLLTPTDLFIKIELYQIIFDMNMSFDFSQLGVYMPLNKEFPAYQAIKRRKAREKLKTAEVAHRDIVEIDYRRQPVRGGIADWMMTINPLEKTGQHFALGLGGILMGGDITVNGTASGATGFQPSQINYRWRYPFYNNPYISHIEVGRVNSSGGMARNLTGAMVTNKPMVRREHFQTTTVSGHAGEGWEVELYVNGKLSDYTPVDRNGNYTFLVDIDYGASNILIKKYGPNGEYETHEEYIRIPFNLIPRGTFEYTAAAGEQRVYGERKRYAQAFGNYGLFNFLTIGASAEIPLKSSTDKVEREKPIFAGEATLQPMGNMLLGGFVSRGYITEYSVSYSQPSLFNVGGGYTRFSENPNRNRLKQLSRIQFSISTPLRIGKRYLGPRFRATLNEFEAYKITSINFTIKLPLYRCQINYMGLYKTVDYRTRSEKKITSQFFIPTSFFRKIRPQFTIHYEHDLNQISKIGFSIQRRLFRQGQLSFNFERNTLTEVNSFLVSFSLFTDFAGFTSRVNVRNHQTVFTQTQRGSIRFDQEALAFRFDRRNGLGKGSAVVWPFLDENYNGQHDDGEELLTELRANVGGARGIQRGKQKVYYYDGLRPYDEYLVQIDQYSLDNPTLRPAHENFRVIIDPNIVTSIKVPIVTAAEISGIVERVVRGNTVGVGGMKVHVVNERTGRIDIIRTFNNGDYFYLGLVPGVYRAYLDPRQLEQYGYRSEPSEISFQVRATAGGDIVENINFRIVPQ